MTQNSISMPSEAQTSKNRRQNAKTPAGCWIGLDFDCADLVPSQRRRAFLRGAGPTTGLSCSTWVCQGIRKIMWEIGLLFLLALVATSVATAFKMSSALPCFLPPPLRAPSLPVLPPKEDYLSEVLGEAGDVEQPSPRECLEAFRLQPSVATVLHTKSPLLPAAHGLVLSRLCGGCGGDQISEEELTLSMTESPITVAGLKLVAAACCRTWMDGHGLLVDGIGSLHQSRGGSGVLSSVIQLACSYKCKFLVCLAASDAIGWWANVPGFTPVDVRSTAVTEHQLKLGCVKKDLDVAVLAQNLQQLSSCYQFGHAVMLRWV